MITDIEITEVFPIPIGDVYIKDKKLINGLVDEIYAEMKKDPKGATISNRGGWQSDGLSKIGPLTQSLRKLLIPTIQKFYRDCYNTNSADCLKITGIWANVNPKLTYNTQHIHPGSQVSGVLYVKVPDDVANIEFHSPTKDTKMAVTGEISDGGTNYNYDSYWFRPEVGRLILFPSHLAHSVDISESDGDRISIAFNASYFDRRWPQ
mgnify:CR=1 FL=1|jgi:uncharacterized protein (TIGR02466 family)|tara:strand:- start:969 stop:1589 length:621 start_codon:yes stop_codon:yes gene_type:complete